MPTKPTSGVPWCPCAPRAPSRSLVSPPRVCRRSTFEREVTQGSSTSGGDPLDAWVRYIRWAQEGYPSGATEVRLKLERCVRECIVHERYRQDKRFIKVCIKYADACTDACTVFDFMAKEGVGAQSTLFYVARATLYEAGKNYSAAKRVFAEGVHKGAEPATELAARMADFKRRMAKHAAKSSDASKKSSKGSFSSSGSRSRGTGHRTERQTLNRIGSGAASSGRRPMSRTAGKQHPNARRRDASSSKSSSSTTPASENFQVFDDSDPVPESTGASGSALSAPPWSQLATHSQRHKENTGTATTWTECTIAQREGSTVPAPMSGFSVFTDESCEPAEKLAAVSERRGGLRVHLDEPSAACTTDAKVDTMLLEPQPQPVESTIEPVAAPSKPQAGGLAIFQDNTDAQAAAPGDDDDEAVHDDDAPSPTVNTMSALDDVAGMFSGTRATSDTPSCTDELPPSGSTGGLCVLEDEPVAAVGLGLMVFEDAPVAAPSKPQAGGLAIFQDDIEPGDDDDAPSPTVNTMSALDDVAEMFSSSLRATQSCESATEDDSPMARQDEPQAAGGLGGFTVFSD